MADYYEISEAAEKDWQDIIRYTLNNFGKTQVRKYTMGLIKCLDSLLDGEALYKEIKIENHRVMVHLCQKHYIFALHETNRLFVIAIFHEQMNLMQRLKDRLE